MRETFSIYFIWLIAWVVGFSLTEELSLLISQIDKIKMQVFGEISYYGIL